MRDADDVVEDVAAPLGTVAFLFTDVVGSTRLWEECPSEMEVALAQHDELVSSAAAQHGGYVFSTAGDSFGIAFRGVDAAVSSAVATQRALEAASWPQGCEIQVRMGIDVGEASERSGDYFGPVVNRAARLMSSAHGGQIVLTSTAAGLFSEGHAELLDLGDHVLKDLSGRIGVYQVVGAGLRSSFPALGTVNVFPQNLPARVDALVGRTSELADLLELVRASELTTIVGPGGMGKTRLSLQVSADLIEEFVDGVWFVDLVPAADDIEDISAAIGRAMNFDARQRRTWSDTVLSALQPRSLLLVLDNCEHVVATVARLTQLLLERCPSVQILATSRERLEVTNEQVYRLGPLDAGPELFDVRASSLDRGFDLAQSRAAVDEICERLDGLPLGIELAASRVPSLQPEEIAALLGERFRLLKTRSNVIAERHQTLKAAVDWSYQLLPVEAQVLFHRLGVFNTAFDFEAACGVAEDPDDEYAVADLLSELESKSLITISRVDDRTYYRLLETMSAFARDLLDETRQLESVRRQHAESRLRLTRQRMTTVESSSPQSTAAFRAMLRDMSDIEVSFAWFAQHDQHSAEELFLALTPLIIAGAAGYSRSRDLARALLKFDDASPMAKALACLTLCASGGGTTGDRLAQDLLKQQDLPNEARAVALAAASWGHGLLRNEPIESSALAEESISLLVHCNDAPTIAIVRMWAIIQHVQNAQIDDAIRQADANEELRDELELGYTRYAWYLADGQAHRLTDVDRSTTAFRRCVELLAAYGDIHGQAFAQYHLGLNELIQRNNLAATNTFVEALPALLDRGDQTATTHALEDLATVLTRRGESEPAVTAFSIAASSFEGLHATGHTMYVARRERLLAQLAEKLGSQRFNAAWAEGANLTLDEGIRYICHRMPDNAHGRLP